MLRFIKKSLLQFIIVMIFVLLVLCGSSAAEVDSGELARKSQNPIANMISVPFQYNLSPQTGPYERPLHVLNIQPVMPFQLNENWNIIARTIIPVISQPQFISGQGRETGLGDINMTLFFSPRKAEKLIWGIGPVFQFPTATDDRLGADKWCAGIAGVALKMKGPWVYGALINNIWSFAGDDDRDDVNQMLIQPFINYNLPKGWYYSFSPVITANWEADSGNQWTVPLGLGVGRVMTLGKQPVNISAAAYYNVEKPEYVDDWQIRLQFTLLYPK